MSSNASHVLEDALLLPAVERAQLAEQLLRSLNAPLEPDVEAAWAQAAEARRQAVIKGEAEPASGNNVISRLRAR